MAKSKHAFVFSAQRLARQSIYMWTFTLAEAVDIHKTRKLWNHLLTLMRRRWPKLCGLRVFEMHETHGLHVHLVTNRFIDVNEVRRLAKRSGWGRIHVAKVPADRASYLAKYLGKERPQALKGWRLWAGFGPWEWSRVKDIVVRSPVGDAWRECRRIFSWTGKEPFWQRQQLAQSVYHARLRDDRNALEVLGFRTV
jgi:hypothetical protein